VWKLIDEGGVLEKTGEHIWKNSNAGIRYVVDANPKVNVESLHIKLRGYAGKIELMFHDGVLVQKVNVVEEVINGQVFEGHTKHFADRILRLVRDNLKPPTPT
jgi:hypothetical protein